MPDAGWVAHRLSDYATSAALGMVVVMVAFLAIWVGVLWVADGAARDFGADGRCVCNRRACAGDCPAGDAYASHLTCHVFGCEDLTPADCEKFDGRCLVELGRNRRLRAA